MATSTFSDGSLSALGLTPEVWQRLSPLLDAAMELPLSARDVWLQGLPPEHDELRPLLERLLAQRVGAPLTLPSLDEPEDDDRRAGDTVGPYRLLRPLGQGGMGTVWLAQRTDGGLQRPVALKLPRLEGPSRHRLAERLARERDLLATLSHPHIAQLHDAGLTEQGQPYLALEWVSGERIDRWCSRHQLDTAARVRLFLQVAQAVAHAHAKLIVHRDLKPSNLLVDEQGQVKLLDFGIAKLLDTGPPTDSTLTREHARPLTPDYASPEQLTGADVDTRSDVYSLGVMLYELLTSQRPYRVLRPSLVTLTQAVLHDMPARPSQVVGDMALRRQLAGDLDTIVLKALKKSPDERYPTVMALAEDLQRHLDHRPVLARPESLGYVLRRLVARHRVACAAAALALLAIVGAAGVAAWQAQRAERERVRAQEVKAFLARLLHDASPWRPAAASWRTNRLVVQALRSSAAGTSSAADANVVSALGLLRQTGRQLDQDRGADPAVRAELQRVIGASLVGFGAVREGERRIEQALARAERELGARHPQVLRLRLAQVQLSRLEAQPMAAEAALHALLPPLRALAQGGELQALETLAEALQVATLQALDGDATGRQFSDEAQRRAFHLADEADAVCQRLPPGHGERTRNAVLQAVVRRVQGHADTARDAAEHALQELGDASAVQPTARAALRGEAWLALARAQIVRGDLAAALRAYDGAADEARRLLGSSTVLVAVLLHGSARAALQLGDVAQARRRANQAQASATVRDDGVVADMLRATDGAVRVAEGRTGEGLALLDAALPGLLRVFGPQHELAIGTQAWRLTALARDGHAERARAADRGWPAVLGNSPERQQLRAQLARARAAAGLAP